MTDSPPNLVDDTEFVEALHERTVWLVAQLRDRRSGFAGIGEPIQIAMLLESFVRIRDEIDNGLLLSADDRQRRTPIWIILEVWGPYELDAHFLHRVVDYYFERADRRFPTELASRTVPEAHEIVEEARRLLATKDPPIGPVFKVDPPAGSRPMPHEPDPGSLLSMRSFADSAEPQLRRDAPAARERRDAQHFANWAQQHAVIALLDYWLGRPVAAVGDRLSEACDVQLQAMALGLAPNPWQVEEWLTTALAIDHLPLANRLADLGQERWGHERVKPVQWLVARIAALIAIWRKDQQESDQLLAIEHEALYHTQLPPELTPDLPLMRTHFWLLRTLRLGDASGFNEALTERMRVRVDHFRAGGTIAPAALMDLPALAMCRLARGRGIEPRVQHVYLPLQLIGS